MSRSRDTSVRDSSVRETGSEGARPAGTSLEDRQAELRELDTLIAFEDYDGASRALAPLVAAEPDNAEYRLRLAHVEAQRGNATASDRELEALSAMMDGPLSDTMARVRRIGRELMPGNPAFDTRLPDAPERLPGHAAPEVDEVEESASGLLDDAMDVRRAGQL